MNFNLIDEKWIPVKRKDGTPDRIRPWEVTDDFEKNPVVALDAPRPDFNGALIQFLIGLVQTAFAPAKPIEWKQKLKTPPTPDQLKTAFMTVHHAFELGGDGPRFMQDFDDFKKTPKPIGWLLIGAATKNAIDENTDHFVKRDTVSSLCPSCCAAALMTMQTNSPSGGQGYRTSLRGGGPLTTLVIGDGLLDTIWHTIWLNVLNTKAFLSMCNQAKKADGDMFPWLSNTKAQATEQDIHPAQYFWAMPRRMKLTLNKVSSGACGLCSRGSDELISTYKEVNRGTEYQAPMKHPLSPYNGSTLKAVLCRPGGVNYRHWLGLVVGDTDGNREPARIVHEFINNRQQTDWQFRLWAFGYDIVPGQNKARCWYDAKIPLIAVEQESVSEYEDKIATLIKAANTICGNTKIAIKRVLHGIPEYDLMTRHTKWKYRDIKKLDADEEKARERVLNSVREQSLFMSIETSFWQVTESAFYIMLRSVIDCIKEKKDSSEFLEQWQHTLYKAALQQFDSYILNAPIEDMKVKHISLAQRELDNFNRGARVRQILGLP